MIPQEDRNKLYEGLDKLVKKLAKDYHTHRLIMTVFHDQTKVSAIEVKNSFLKMIRFIAFLVWLKRNSGWLSTTMRLSPSKSEGYQ